MLLVMVRVLMMMVYTVYVYVLGEEYDVGRKHQAC